MWGKLFMDERLLVKRMMDSGKTTDQALADAIDYWVKFFNRRRRRNKFAATIIRLLIVLLAALVTVSLAVDLSEKYVSIPSHQLKLFAIVCSALSALLAAFETFVDHKRMWVTNGISLSRAILLRQRLSVLSSTGPISKNETERMLSWLSEIAEADAESWGTGRLQSQDVIDRSHAKQAGQG